MKERMKNMERETGRRNKKKSKRTRINVKTLDAKLKLDSVD
jgi:hypothetical protein